MNKMRAMKRFLTVLLAAALLISTCAPAALASFQAKVFTTTKAYNVPSTSGKSIKVPKGLTVSVTGTSGSWARISYKGHSAYIPIPYLNLKNRMTAYTAKSTPVYKQPTSSSSKMGTLSIGTAVYVVNKVNGYYRIQNSSGSATGYVKSGYLTSKAKITAAYNAYKKAQAAKKKASSSSPKKSSTSKSPSSPLLSLLKSLLGRPYSSGATLSSAPRTFNCSTLVRYVMEKFGHSMKATASEQANDGRYAKISSISSLKVGDIVCFDGNKDGVCDHTGIYVGGSKFVEASQTAKKVHVNALDSWYKEHFMWARRP